MSAVLSSSNLNVEIKTLGGGKDKSIFFGSNLAVPVIVSAPTGKSQARPSIITSRTKKPDDRSRSFFMFLRNYSLVRAYKSYRIIF